MIEKVWVKMVEDGYMVRLENETTQFLSFKEMPEGLKRIFSEKHKDDSNKKR